VTYGSNVTLGDSIVISGAVYIPPGTIISSFAVLIDGSRVGAQPGRQVNITYTEGGVTVGFTHIPEEAHRIEDLIKDTNRSAVNLSGGGVAELVDDDGDFGIRIYANGSIAGVIEAAETGINPENGSKPLTGLRGSYLYIRAPPGINSSNTENITIWLRYPGGLDESTVYVNRFNPQADRWERLTAGTWKANGSVYVNVTELSVYGVSGEAKVPQPIGGGGGDGAGTVRPRLVLLANSIDYNLSSNFTAFLEGQGIDIVYVDASNFSEYKTEKFIVILGGPDTYEGVGEIVREVLDEGEQGWLREKGNRRMYVKTSVWRMGQVVMIIAGSDRWQTRLAVEENRLVVKEKVEGG
jgi:hypothetical protein